MLSVNDRTLNQFNALNKWLSDVYGEGTHFGALLIDSGFNDTEIEQIKQEHLSEFLQAVLNLLESYHDLSREERNMLMLQHYGLIDGKPQNLYAMGAKLGVCGERVRQLVHQRLNLYKNPKRQLKLRSDFATIGRRLLSSKTNSEE